MNCKQCNKEIAEDALFCKDCGHRGPLEEQKSRVEELKNNLSKSLSNQTRSPIFLVFTICFTLMTLSQIGSIFGGGFKAILPSIFMIIGTIALWTSYGAKDNASLVKKIKRASIYDGYMNVYYTIITIILILVMVAAIVLVSIPYMMTPGELDWGSFLKTILIVAGVMVVALIIVTNIHKIYRNRRVFFLALNHYAETGEYNVEKAPVVGSYIVAIWSFFGGIASFLTSVLSSLLMSALAGILDGAGDSMGGSIDQIFEIIEKLLVSNSIASILSGVSGIVLGGYYLLSAIWISKTHKALLAANEAVKVENTKLAALEASTADAIKAYEAEQAAKARREKEAAEAAERQRRQEEEEEERQRKLEEERARQREAEEAAQKQAQEQQMMMMQMMQQMMANMNNNPQKPADSEEKKD